MLHLTVSNSLSGQSVFPTLTSALAAAGAYPEESVCLHVSAGVYREKVEVCRSNVSILGESAETTIITFDDYAKKLWPDGTNYGTFRSYTMLLDGHDITLSGLTIENANPTHTRCGQAIALYTDGDRIAVTDCILKSYQDTLFTGPLPPTAVIPGGFTGPKEFAPRVNGRQYYRNCKISGDIDFIFGSATAYFENCDIIGRTDEKSLLQAKEKAASGEAVTCGYLTAASTPEGQTYGYVFSNCRLQSDCPSASFYLGRPWRNHARTVFLNCEMGAHIKPDGFHDWNKPDAHETVFFAEYQSFGPGAADLSARASFCRILSDEEAAHYSRDRVLGNPADWKMLTGEA